MGNMAQATVLYDVADRPVFTIFKEQRIEVPLAQMSPNLIDAVLSIEDQRFYQHRGVDVIRIIGAVLVNLQHGRVAQGGSTVTQQLARQSFLTLERSLTPQDQGSHPRRAASSAPIPSRRSSSST